MAKITPRNELKAGLFCLGACAAVIGVKLWKQASWGVDGIEAVVTLAPIGIYLVLKSAFGFDIVARVKRLAGSSRTKEEQEEQGDEPPPS